MSHYEMVLENFLIGPALEGFGSLKSKLLKRFNKPKPVKTRSDQPVKKYRLSDIEIGEWLAENYTKISSYFDGSKGEWLVTNIGDPVKNDMLSTISRALKEGAWEYKEPIMLFGLMKNNKTPGGVVAAYTSTYEHMATEGIVSAGYVTIKFVEGSLEGMIARTDTIAKTELWYHEVWNIDNPDVLQPNGHYAITSMSWNLNKS